MLRGDLTGMARGPLVPSEGRGHCQSIQKLFRLITIVWRPPPGWQPPDECESDVRKSYALAFAVTRSEPITVKHSWEILDLRIICFRAVGFHPSSGAPQTSGYAEARGEPGFYHFQGVAHRLAYKDRPEIWLTTLLLLNWNLIFHFFPHQHLLEFQRQRGKQRWWQINIKERKTRWQINVVGSI